jgi:hypothetical protein
MVKRIVGGTPAAVRDAALQYFVRVGEPARPFLPEVVKLFADENPHIRTLALSVVYSAKGSADHIAAIVPLLKDPRVEVRSTAAECLAQAGKAARPHLPALHAALGKASTARFKTAVLTAVEEIGGLTIAEADALSPFLKDKDDQVRVAAMGAITEALVEAGPDALKTDAAAKALNEKRRAQYQRESFEIRAAILENAVDDQQSADLMVNELADIVRDGKPEVKVAALHALGQGREHALAHLALVTGKLNAPEADLRAAALNALRMMGAKAVAPNLDAVAAALRDESGQVRSEALLALPLAGDALKRFPYRVRTVFPDASEGVRGTLLKAVAVIVNATGVDDEWLAEGRDALHSPDPGLRTAMCFVAAQFGIKNGARLQPDVVALLKDPEAGVRGAAAIALRSYAGDVAGRANLRAALRPLLKDADAEIRWAVLDTLHELDPGQDAALIEEIAGMMKDEEQTVRGAAMRALSAAGAGAKPHLADFIREFHEDPAIPPFAAAEAVTCLGPLNTRELTALLYPAFVYSELIPVTRATAHAATAGEADGQILLRLIGRNAEPAAAFLKPADAARATALLQDALQATPLHPKLKQEIEARLIEIQKLPQR